MKINFSDEKEIKLESGMSQDFQVPEARMVQISGFFFKKDISVKENDIIEVYFDIEKKWVILYTLLVAAFAALCFRFLGDEKILVYLNLLIFSLGFSFWIFISKKLTVSYQSNSANPKIK
ncbi:MAG: hypothetical protein H7Y04_15010 [Verrucomicrobia bacterium]|nr:hypothetical protein [Cytophagales bacterium]